MQDFTEEQSNAGQSTITQITMSTIAHLSIPGGTVFIHPNTGGTGTLQADSEANEIQQPPRGSVDRQDINLQRDLENILNKRIRNENLELLTFGEGLATPRHEKMAQLRICSVYHGSSGISDQSLRELQTFRVEEVSGKAVTVQEVFSGVRFVAILGGPGSGKSTFVRRYGLMVLNSEIEEMQEVKIVYFINACELAANLEETDFLTFIFSKLEHSFASINPEDAVGWLQDEENQKKMLIIIDGLNDIRGLTMDKCHPSITYKERAKPEVILYNLLHGRLLPGARILAATRSHGIQNYDEAIRPKRTLKLVGFSTEDAKYLFQEITQSAGNGCWERLSESLKSLCCTPVWLVYVAYIKIYNPKIEMDNVSSILVCLLQNFHNKNWSDDAGSETFKNLKKFCLENLKRSKGIFTESDIKEFSLKKEHILNLCLTVPMSHKMVFERSRHDSYIYFSHILILESLACLGFLDLSLEEYRNVIDEHLFTPDFCSVRQMSCGILLNPKKRESPNHLIRGITDGKEKARLLQKSFRDTKNMSPDELLQHLICIQEAGGPQSRKDFSRVLPAAVNLDMRVLSLSSLHATTAVISGCKSLSELSFYGCSLDDAKVKMLADILSTSNLKISILGLGAIQKISPAGIKDVATVVRHCNVQTLDLHLCQLRADHARTLLEQLKEGGVLKLERLLLRSNFDLQMDGMEAIAGIVEVASLKELDVSHCGVSESVLENMGSQHDLSSLQILVLSGYKAEGQSRMRVVGKLAAENNIDELHINWCNLKCDDLKCFENSIRYPQRKVQIRALNVSNNKINAEECHRALVRIAKLCRTERMDIHKCDFTKEQKEELKQSAHVKEFTRMDTYRSFNLNIRKFRQMLQQNRGRFLDMSLTKTSLIKLSKVPNLLDEYGTRFRKLCLPEGKKATDEDLAALVKLVPYISEELWLAEWDISPSGREKLAAARRKQLTEFPNFDIRYAADDSSRYPKLPSH